MTETFHTLSGNGLLTAHDALTSEDGIRRVLGRAAASSMTEAIAAWFNAEIERPEFDANAPDDLLVAFAAYVVQLHSSFTAYFVAAEDAPAAAERFIHVASTSYADHLAATRVLLEDAP